MADSPKRRWPQPHWADLITLAGILGSMHEVFLRSGSERPGIQFMCIAMMGVSPAVRIDERRNQRRAVRDQSSRPELGPPEDHQEPPGRFGR